MSAGHREWLERMSAPLVAWMIDNGSVVNEGGILDVTPYGRVHFREQTIVAARAIQGHRPHPMPEGKNHG